MTPSRRAIPSRQLEAFFEVARSGNFSQAAQTLSLTQSALSQRVLLLESQLETALFIRAAGGARLTAAGEELLRYCRAQRGLEDEALARIGARHASDETGPAGKGRRDAPQLAGTIRIAAYSSVLRSVVMPALGELIRRHPAVDFDLQSREMRELGEALRRGEADLIVSDHPLQRQGIESQLLGYEENVLVESRGGCERPSHYLDHDIEDTTTERYLKAHGADGFGRSASARGSGDAARGRSAARAARTDFYTRSFVGDIYGILDGVALGLGRGVVSRHLLADRRDLRVIAPTKALRNPVYMHFYAQAWQPRLFTETLAALQSQAPKYLAR